MAMKALVTTASHSLELKDGVSVPTPGEGQVLIKVEAAALNPADWKSVMMFDAVGGIGGTDFAGTISKLGPGVDATKWKVGDRVASFVLAYANANGSYSEYLTSSTHLLIRIPDGWNYETAAQLGASSLTAAQTLWESQKLPKPFEEKSSSEPITLLVWSGATATGHYVIQFAKLSGLKVIVTGSPKHFERLKAIGADEVFDYNDPDVVAKIKAATGNKLKHAVDCFSEQSSISKVEEAIGDEGGVISALNMALKISREDVEVRSSKAYNLLAEARPGPGFFAYTPRAEDKEFGQWAADLTTKTIGSGKLVPLPIKVWPSGLAGVTDAFKYMQNGKVSGEKIVFRIKDTPGL